MGEAIQIHAAVSTTGTQWKVRTRNWSEHLVQPAAFARAGAVCIRCRLAARPVRLFRSGGNAAIGVRKRQNPAAGGCSGEEGHDQGGEVLPDQVDAAAGGRCIVGCSSLFQQGPEMGRVREFVCRGAAFDRVSQSLEGGQVFRRQGLFEFRQPVLLDGKKLIEDWFEIAADASADAVFTGWSVHKFPGLDAAWRAHYLPPARP